MVPDSGRRRDPHHKDAHFFDALCLGGVLIHYQNTGCIQPLYFPSEDP